MLCHEQDARGGVELWEVGPPVSQNDSLDSCSSGGSWGSSDPRPVLHTALSHPPLSLREHPPPLHQGLSRSCSFGGLLGSRRSGGTLRTGWADQGILGQPTPTTASPRDVRRGLALHPHVKLPKTPRPDRAVSMTGAVTRGLRDTVHATQQDLSTLHQDQRHYQLALSQGRVYEVEKQLKAAERYLKKIEYHLSKLEDLQDQYHHNQRLRDGVKTMAYAYALSPGKDKTSALSNVRSGYKECTETLCTLEVQIEQLLGTFTLEMKGIQGFARLCPGDVFEVVIRHGSQKWKTRGRVGKDSTQTWENPKMVFKSLIGDMLVMKAVEVKMLGKTVIIGSKMCETKDLFSPHPQLMTVNLNPSGSLKLNVVITWNPLDGVLEDSLVRTPSLSTTSPGGRRRQVIHSSPPLTIASLPSRKDGLSPECDHDSSFGSMSARSSSTTDSASPLSEYRGLMSSCKGGPASRADSNSPLSDYQGMSRRTDSQDSILYEGRDCTSPSCDVTGNFTLVRKKNSLRDQWTKYSQYSTSDSPVELMTRSFPQLPTSASPFTSTLSQSLSHHLDTLGAESEAIAAAPQPPRSLYEVISCLRNCLEDIQGQFPELHTLEEAILDLNVMSEQCNNNTTRRSSSTSDISLSVESALECFNFLNTDFQEYQDNLQDSISEVTSESKDTTSCNNDTDLQTLEEDTPPITGSSQLDQLLYIHLCRALGLIQHLGCCGPVKLKEKMSLDQLSRGGKLLSTILAHRNNLDSLRPHHIITVPHLQVLWDSVASPDAWCVSASSVVTGLLPVVSSLVTPDHHHTPVHVLQHLVCEMSGDSSYTEEITITAGDFLLCLLPPLQDIVPRILHDLHTLALLTSGEADKVASAFENIKKPSYQHLLALTSLLQGDGDASNAAQNFMQQLPERQPLNRQIVEGCLLQIMSSSSSDRVSACYLLSHLAVHAVLDGGSSEWPRPVEVLTHVQQNDPSSEVRWGAREALLRLGSEGEEALHHSQLSSHGFQGVEVREKSK